jgi:hypothetical protein
VLADFCWHRLRACEFMLPLEELEALATSPSLRNESKREILRPAARIAKSRERGKSASPSWLQHDFGAARRSRPDICWRVP